MIFFWLFERIVVFMLCVVSFVMSFCVLCCVWFLNWKMVISLLFSDRIVFGLVILFLFVFMEVVLRVNVWCLSC